MYTNYFLFFCDYNSYYICSSLNTGCEKQIEELIEAVVLPMREADRFKKIGISPPKGVLLWGPPGTGKTLLARACAKHTDAGTLSH